MKTSNQFEIKKQTSILLVGDPGTRKTSLALQFPKPYVLDVDDNLTGPIRHFGSDLPFLWDSAHVVSEDWKVPGTNTKYQEGDKLKPEHQFLWAVKCLNDAASSEEVETIILDSITAFVDIMIAEVKRQQGRSQDSEMRIQDWGKFAYLVKHVVMTLKSGPKTTVVTLHNLIDKDEADGRYKTFLSVPGQSKNTLGAFFNHVWALYVKQGGPPNKRTYEHRVRTMPNGDTDHRGVKPGSALPTTMSWEEAAQHVREMLGSGTKAEEGATPQSQKPTAE